MNAEAELAIAVVDALAAPAERSGRGGRGANKGARRGEHGETIVKRAARKAHDDDHGGTWKVAFADFCLALMCLFLLLWVLGARDEEEARAKLVEMADGAVYEGGAGMFDSASKVFQINVHPDSTPARVSDATPPNQPAATSDALHALAERVRTLADEAGLRDNLQAIVTPVGLRVMLHDTDGQGVFVRGGATPSEPFRPLLAKLGALMGAVGNPLLVIGHTDSVPYRGFGIGARSNWHLSGDRAMSARRVLLGGGMASAQVLQVIGMADRAPLSDDPRAAVNRRIEFLVLTPQRAQAMQAMFGVPDQVVPLVEGVNAVSAGAASGAQTVEIGAAESQPVADFDSDLTKPGGRSSG